LRYLCAWWLPLREFSRHEDCQHHLVVLILDSQQDRVVNSRLAGVCESPRCRRADTPLSRPLPVPMNVSKSAADGAGLGIAGSSSHCALVSWSSWKLFPPPQLISKLFGSWFGSQCN